MSQQRMPFRLVAMPVFVCVFAFLSGIIVLGENKVVGWGLIIAAVVTLPLQVTVRRLAWKKGYLPVRR